MMLKERLKRLRAILNAGLGRKFEIVLNKRSDLAGYDIGKWSYGDVKVLRWRVNGHLTIGKFCSFAESTVIMLGGDHNPRNISTFPFGVYFGGVPEGAHASTRGDVSIGNDVWVGRNSTILSGVTIGDGAVIGANSLVSRDVPAYAVAAGNPARIVRMRFSDDEISELLSIRWWDWNDAQVKEVVPLLMSGNIAEFIRIARLYRTPNAGQTTLASD